MDPTMAMGRRASGGADPPPASTALMYLREKYGIVASAANMPTRRPMKVKPVCHKLKSCLAKTMAVCGGCEQSEHGELWKRRYSRKA